MFPSGQRGQTVNLLTMSTVVRIHPLPPKRLAKASRFFIFISPLDLTPNCNGMLLSERRSEIKRLPLSVFPSGGALSHAPFLPVVYAGCHDPAAKRLWRLHELYGGKKYRRTELFPSAAQKIKESRPLGGFFLYAINMSVKIFLLYAIKNLRNSV